MSRLGEVVGSAIVGVVSAGIVIIAAGGCPPPPAPAPTPVTGQVPQGDALERDESDPQWNCITDGNGMCGPAWVALTTGQLEAIIIAHDGIIDWGGCLTDQVTVVCPDTYVYVWEWVPVTDYGLV